MSFIKYNFFCSSTNAVQGWPVAETICTSLFMARDLLYQLVLLVSTCFLFCSSGFSLMLQRFPCLRVSFACFWLSFLILHLAKHGHYLCEFREPFFFKREGWFFFNNPITVSWRPHRFYSSSNCLAVLIYHLYQSSPWLFKTVHLMLLY